MLSAVTGDKRITNAWDEVKYIKNREGDNMAEEWIDKLEERGEMRGRKEGEKEGLELGKIVAYNDVGFSVEKIAEKVGISIDRVKHVLGKTTKIPQ